MEHTINITIPDDLKGLFESKVRDLTARGFSLAEAVNWAAIYIKEYSEEKTITAEKVIETFGVSILHTPANIKHLANKLKQEGALNKVDNLVAAAHEAARGWRGKRVYLKDEAFNQFLSSMWELNNNLAQGIEKFSTDQKFLKDNAGTVHKYYQERANYWSFIKNS